MMNRTVLTFIFVNFIVSAVSDIVLNDLAHSSRFANKPGSIIGSLRPYFDNRTILGSAAFAGITVVSALIALMLMLRAIGISPVLSSWRAAPMYLAIAYAVGYVWDVAIDRWNLFGDDLKEYYNLAGAGKWGAIAFVFSIVISFILQKYFIPLL